jgi:hypothetical protein
MCNSVESLLSHYNSSIQHDSYITCLTEAAETLILLLHIQLDALTDCAAGTVSTTTRLVYTLLLLISKPPRALAMLTYDLWCELENYSTEERSAYIDAVVLPQLLPVLVSHALYTMGGVEDVGYDEEEDLCTYRDLRLGLDEVLLLCVETCPVVFYSILYNYIYSFSTNSDVNSAWNMLEIVLYILHACMSKVKTQLSLPVLHVVYDNTTCTTSTNTKGTVQQFLVDVALVGMQHMYINGVVRESVCNYLSSITYLLTSGTSNIHGTISTTTGSISISQLYYQSVTQCLQTALLPTSSTTTTTTTSSSMYKESVCLAGAKAFHKLAIHGVALLVQPATDQDALLLEQCIHYIVQHYTTSTTSNNSEEVMLLLVEACTRSVLSVSNHDAQAVLLVLLSQPVLTGLALVVQQPHSMLSTAELLVGYVSQLIRFCDSTGSTNGNNNNGEHVLLSLLDKLWPLLQTVAQVYSDGTTNATNSSSKLLSRIFEVYSRILLSLGPSAPTSLLPTITTSIIYSVQHTTGYCAAAIRASSTCIDYIFNHHPDNDQKLYSIYNFVHEILINVHKNFVEIINASPSSTTSMFLSYPANTYDMEALDELCRLLHTTLTAPSTRTIYTNPSLLTLVLPLLVSILRCCTERDPLRNVYAAISSIYAPPRYSTSSSTADNQKLLVQHSSNYIRELVLVLLLQISSNRITNMMISNVADSIYSILYACVGIDSTITTNNTSSISNSSTYKLLHDIVQREDIFTSSISPTYRIQLLHILLVLVVQEQGRRCKALLVDIYKVCTSEDTVDVLAAYEDVVVGI